MAEAAEKASAEALTLFLQHPRCYLHQHLVAKLLSTSKSTGAAVRLYCCSQVPIVLRVKNIETVQSFCTWLQHHACLVKSLEFAWRMRFSIVLPDVAAVSKAGSQLAAALQTAVITAEADLYPSQQRHQVLQLRSFKAATPMETAGAVLLQLPTDHLTSLYITCEPSTCSDSSIAAALPRLTNLATLDLARNRLHNKHALDPLLTGLLRLTRLTTLHLEGTVSNPAVLLQLPQQLQRLHLAALSPRAASAPPLDVAHLTGLQQLTCRSSPSRHRSEFTFSPARYDLVHTHLQLLEDDVLPPNLQVLSVSDCPTVEPLLGLLQLQRLEMFSCTAPAQQLLRLSKTLPGLTDVRLGYFDDGQNASSSGSTGAAAAAAAAGAGAAVVPGVAGGAAVWHALPLRSLVLRSKPSYAPLLLPTVQHISCLTGLTSLTMQGRYPCEASMQRVAAAIQPLTSLQHLSLCEVYYAAPSAGDAKLPSLFNGISGLPVLKDLRVSRLSSCTAAVQLTKCTTLTSLSLHDCGLDDITLYMLACTLTGLKHLDVGSNVRVSDVPMAAIGVRLQQLTALDVSGSGVTEKGVARVAGLRQLQQLRAPRVVGTDDGVSVINAGDGGSHCGGSSSSSSTVSSGGSGHTDGVTSCNCSGGDCGTSTGEIGDKQQ